MEDNRGLEIGTKMAVEKLNGSLYLMIQDLRKAGYRRTAIHVWNALNNLENAALIVENGPDRDFKEVNIS